MPHNKLLEPDMRRILLHSISWLVVASALASVTVALANDGFSGLVNGGLEFSRTQHVAMSSEVLTVSPRSISVSYVFENTADTDVEGTVAFPIIVRCGYWDTPADYPDMFSTRVDGQSVQTKTELRAFLRSGTDVEWAYPRFAKGVPGSEISGLLSKASLPIDCRKAPPESAAYKQLMARGFAFDPTLDPWIVFYETRISHYWTQRFAARKSTRIEHSYVPSHGGGNNGPYGNKKLMSNIALYKDFFQSTPALSHLVKDFQPHNGYVSIDYVLTTANTWAGPIRKFELVVPKPKHFIVTTLNGDISLRNGDLVITKYDFSPQDELSVVFYGDVMGYENVRF